MVMTQLAVAVSLNQSLNKTSQRDAVNCAPAGGVKPHSSHIDEIEYVKEKY